LNDLYDNQIVNSRRGHGALRVLLFVPLNEIHEDTVGIIWRIRNDLIPGDCWFSHEEIDELQQQ